MPDTSKWADIQDTGKMDTDTYDGQFFTYISRPSVNTGNRTHVIETNASCINKSTSSIVFLLSF